MVGLALGSRIAERSLFYRKNYFYPDSPKAYQISQYDEPLCLGGSLGGRGPGRHRGRALRARAPRGGRRQDDPRRWRLGQDRGLDRLRRRLQPLRHAAARDRDRARPRTPEAARRFLTLLKATIQAIGVSDCDMEKGSLRCDANVSLRRPGESELRPKAELKNMNSFRFLERGIEAELRRQAAIYESGRQHLAADVALRPAARRADGAALEGGGRRLPVLPRAGPRADGAVRRADRAPAIGASRAAGGARGAASSPSSDCRCRTPRC